MAGNACESEVTAAIIAPLRVILSGAFLVFPPRDAGDR